MTRHTVANHGDDTLAVRDVDALDLSASELRSRVRAGDGIRYLVPEAVRQYIIRHRLYRDEGRRS